MLQTRLEICVELMKLAIDFVMVVAEAFGIAIHQNHRWPVVMTTPSRSFAAPLPFVGFLH
ncbi:hypothetical protein DITRI_Ditri08aG0116300 [Diplodiscus trichospermus]